MKIYYIHETNVGPFTISKRDKIKKKMTLERKKMVFGLGTAFEGNKISIVIITFQYAYDTYGFGCR